MHESICKKISNLVRTMKRVQSQMLASCCFSSAATLKITAAIKSTIVIRTIVLYGRKLCSKKKKKRTQQREPVLPFFVSHSAEQLFLSKDVRFACSWTIIKPLEFGQQIKIDTTMLHCMLQHPQYKVQEQLLQTKYKRNRYYNHQFPLETSLQTCRSSSFQLPVTIYVLYAHVQVSKVQHNHCSCVTAQPHNADNVLCYKVLTAPCSYSACSLQCLVKESIRGGNPVTLPTEA